MTMRSLPLAELADMEVWRALQTRITEVTALRLGLYDEDAERVLPPPLPPPACQYVLSEPDRRERCEQFHGAIRAEVRRKRRATCKTCPFGVQYMALPITGAGVLAGHWEGGYVVEPGPPITPDATLDPSTWLSTLAVTPCRTRTEVISALALIDLLQRPMLEAVARRERRRDQVAQLVGLELGRALTATRSPFEALVRCLQPIATVMGAPVTLLYLRDRARESLALAAQEAQAGVLGAADADVGAALARLVAAEERPLCVADVRERPELIEDCLATPKVRGVVAAPVPGLGGLEGVLVLASYAPNAYDLDDQGLLQRLAELLGGVLQQGLQSEPGEELPPRPLRGLV